MRLAKLGNLWVALIASVFFIGASLLALPAYAAPTYTHFKTRMEFNYSDNAESSDYYVLPTNPILTTNTNLLPQAHSRLRLHKNNGEIIETPWEEDNYVGPQAAAFLPAGTADAKLRQCGEIKNNLGVTETIITKVEVQIRYTPNSADPNAFEFIDWLATEEFIPLGALDDIGNLVQSNTAPEITFEYCHLDSNNQIITNAEGTTYLFRGHAHPKSSGLKVKTQGEPTISLLSYLNPDLAANQAGSSKLQLSLEVDDQRQLTLPPFGETYNIKEKSVALFCSGRFIKDYYQLSNEQIATALDFNQDGNCNRDDVDLFSQEFRVTNQPLFHQIKAGDQLIITEYEMMGNSNGVAEIKTSNIHSIYTLAKDYDFNEPDALYLTTPISSLAADKIYIAHIAKGQSAELTINAPKAGVAEGSFGFGNLVIITCPPNNTHYSSWEQKGTSCLYHGTSTNDPLTFKAQINTNQYFVYGGVDLLVPKLTQTFTYNKNQQKLNLKRQINNNPLPFVYGYHANQQGEIINYFGDRPASKGTSLNIDVQAQVLPYLKMTIAGLPAGESACKKAGGNDPVISDVATTGYSVPMGVLSPQHYTQAAQQITIATNAHYGYVLTARALRNFHSSVNDYTSCDQDNCIAMITKPENNEEGVLWNNQESGFGYTMYLVSGDTYLNEASQTSSPVFNPGSSQPGTSNPQPTETMPNASLHFNYVLDGHWQGFSLEKSAQLLNNNRSSSSDILNICYRLKPSMSNRAGKYYAKIVYTATATF